MGQQRTIKNARTADDAGGGEFWVFGYGSLMWRPGFPHGAVEPALLYGYHRAFCIRSVHYRGTRDDPGLVLGLDRGGSCRGRAFRVRAADGDSVLAYLDERELVTKVYLRRRVTLSIAGRRVTAWTYVADRSHPQYVAKLSADACAALIARCRGVAGDNAEYLTETVAHLDELGIAESPLHHLQNLVRARAGGRSPE